MLNLPKLIVNAPDNLDSQIIEVQNELVRRRMHAASMDVDFEPKDLLARSFEKVDRVAVEKSEEKVNVHAQHKKRFPVKLSVMQKAKSLVALAQHHQIEHADMNKLSDLCKSNVNLNSPESVALVDSCFSRLSEDFAKKGMLLSVNNLGHSGRSSRASSIGKLPWYKVRTVGIDVKTLPGAQLLSSMKKHLGTSDLIVNTNRYSHNLCTRNVDVFQKLTNFVPTNDFMGGGYDKLRFREKVFPVTANCPTNLVLDKTRVKIDINNPKDIAGRITLRRLKDAFNKDRNKIAINFSNGSDMKAALSRGIIVNGYKLHNVQKPRRNPPRCYGCDKLNCRISECKNIRCFYCAKSDHSSKEHFIKNPKGEKQCFICMGPHTVFRCRLRVKQPGPGNRVSGDNQEAKILKDLLSVEKAKCISISNELSDLKNKVQNMPESNERILKLEKSMERMSHDLDQERSERKKLELEKIALEDRIKNQPSLAQFQELMERTKSLEMELHKERDYRKVLEQKIQQIQTQNELERAKLDSMNISLQQKISVLTDENVSLSARCEQLTKFASMEFQVLHDSIPGFSDSTTRKQFVSLADELELPIHSIEIPPTPPKAKLTSENILSFVHNDFGTLVAEFDVEDHPNETIPVFHAPNDVIQNFARSYPQKPNIIYCEKGAKESIRAHCIDGNVLKLSQAELLLYCSQYRAFFPKLIRNQKLEGRKLFYLCCNILDENDSKWIPKEYTPPHLIESFSNSFAHNRQQIAAKVPLPSTPSKRKRPKKNPRSPSAAGASPASKRSNTSDVPRARKQLLASLNSVLGRFKTLENEINTKGTMKDVYGEVKKGIEVLTGIVKSASRRRSVNGIRDDQNKANSYAQELIDFSRKMQTKYQYNFPSGFDKL